MPEYLCNQKSGYPVSGMQDIFKTYFMSQVHLTYCCSNPDCRKKFTIEEAERTEGLVQLSAKGSGKAAPWSVSVIHILCPECKNIVSSIHIPADPL